MRGENSKENWEEGPDLGSKLINMGSKGGGSSGLFSSPGLYAYLFYAFTATTLRTWRGAAAPILPLLKIAHISKPASKEIATAGYGLCGIGERENLQDAPQ
jgi:hypothetical protein